MELDINGARIFFTLPIDLPVLGQLKISETMIVSWIVMILITGLCIWLTHDLKEENISKRQAVAELLVEQIRYRQHGREIQIHDSICCSTFRNKCCIKPDQPCRTSKPDIRSVYGSSVGGCGIYHDHCAEDQDQRFWRLLKGIYTADSGYDTI